MLFAGCFIGHLSSFYKNVNLFFSAKHSEPGFSCGHLSVKALWLWCWNIFCIRLFLKIIAQTCFVWLMIIYFYVLLFCCYMHEVVNFNISLGLKVMIVIMFDLMCADKYFCKLYFLLYHIEYSFYYIFYLLMHACIFE